MILLSNLLKDLQLNAQEFNFQFQSHPNYPSALAFSDTLNFLGIKNDAYELEKKYWEELPQEFITIYNHDFALVKKEKQGFKIFSDEVKTVSREDLHQNTTDFVLLFEKTEESPVKNKLNFSWFIYAVFGFILLYSVIFQNWQSAIFNLLSAVGVYISLELFSKKFGKESAVISGICGGVNSTTKKADCNTIIENDKINFLGLKLADFSFVYFLAVLAIGLFLPVTEGFLKLVSFASVLVIAYSLIVQVFIEKSFCKICLLIISLLIGQIAVSSFYFGNEISVKGLFFPLFGFLIAFFGLVFINDLTQQKEKYRKSDIKNLRFKRNYDIFKRELLSKEKFNFQNTEVFHLGKQDAKLHISLVSNPYCGFCKDAHKILEKLLAKYSEISAQIRFNYFAEDDKHEEYKNLISDFKTIWETKTQEEFLKSMDRWFEKRTPQSTESTSEQDLSLVIKTAEENRNLGFTFTPLILINGYPFPDNYDREDIFYFIDDLLEDEEIINEKI